MKYACQVNTQPLYIFNRENSQNSEPQNGPRRGLDFIALVTVKKMLYTFAGELCKDRIQSIYNCLLPEFSIKASASFILIKQLHFKIHRLWASK